MAACIRHLIVMAILNFGHATYEHNHYYVPGTWYTITNKVLNYGLPAVFYFFHTLVLLILLLIISFPCKNVFLFPGNLSRLSCFLDIPFQNRSRALGTNHSIFK